MISTRCRHNSGIAGFVAAATLAVSLFGSGALAAESELMHRTERMMAPANIINSGELFDS